MDVTSNALSFRSYSVTHVYVDVIDFLYKINSLTSDDKFYISYIPYLTCGLDTRYDLLIPHNSSFITVGCTEAHVILLS